MGCVYEGVTILKEPILEAKAAFETIQIEDRIENGFSYSGHIGMALGCEFLPSPAFETVDDADKWLNIHAEKWGSALAVRIPGGWRVGANCAS